MSEHDPYNTEFYNQPQKFNQPNQPIQPTPHRSSKSHIWIGLFLLVLGGVFMLRRLGIELPLFLVSWQMFLITIGVFIGIRKNFQGVSWLILVLIGGLFLLNEFFLQGELTKFILPLILIGSGLFFILRPKKTQQYFNQTGNMEDHVYPGPSSKVNITGENFIEITSIFTGTKKRVFSKNFRGGDMVNIFGGSEIDLIQADINGSAVLEVTAIFGGATLLVPSNWNVVSSDAVAILGEIKDKRISQNIPNNDKILIIKGTIIFGSIDIKSF